MGLSATFKIKENTLNKETAEKKNIIISGHHRGNDFFPSNWSCPPFGESYIFDLLWPKEG